MTLDLAGTLKISDQNRNMWDEDQDLMIQTKGYKNDKDNCTQGRQGQNWNMTMDLSGTLKI